MPMNPPLDSQHPPTQTGAIDTDMLTDLQNLLSEDFAPMMQDFLADLQQSLHDLQIAKSQNDNAAGYDIAHRLKGACLNLGANTLAECCHAMQLLCQSGYIHEADSALTAIQQNATLVRNQLLAILE